jgi:citrate lyase gamma subunit
MSSGIETATRHVGEAGNSGPEIRSDVQVLIESRLRGGIDIELESRVKSYYGEAIRRQAEGVLEALGVRQGSVHQKLNCRCCESG